jgi:hypothetical protein
MFVFHLLHTIHRAIVPSALAAFDTFTVTTWGYGDLTWQNILNNVVTMLKNTITVASVAVFVAGAFMFVISAGEESHKATGKKMMIGALVGLGIVFGAQAILRTTSYFIWG